jgi:predicted permease
MQRVKKMAEMRRFLDTLARNIRCAARRLRRTPLLTITVVATLAVAIGANSAMFSVIDAIVLRPLPFPDADQLVRISQTRLDGTVETNIAPPRLEDWNSLNSTFDAISGYTTQDVSDTTGDLPERVRSATVASRFFDVWGVAPAIGRVFTGAEQGAPTAVISDRYWRERLNADPDVLDRSVVIENQSLSVIGVMPPSFRYPDPNVDLWRPNLLPTNVIPRFALWYTGVARLKGGVTVDEARADLAVVQARLAEQYPDSDAGIGARIIPLKDSVLGDVRKYLWILFGAVTVLLLIACTNVAALLFARSVQREREVAIQFSLGASRKAVAAQLLTESFALTVIGAIAGVLVARGATSALNLLAPNLPRLDGVSIDANTVIYMVACVLIVTLLCGVLPAILGTGASHRLTRGVRSEVTPRYSLQWSLVGTQIALSVTLLVASGLLMRSFYLLSQVDPGFDLSRVLVFRVTGNYAETNDYGRLVRRINGTIDTLTELPSVEAAASASGLPGDHGQTEFGLLGAESDFDSRLVGQDISVSPSYFQTMGIAILSGELCRRPEDGVPTEVMVNQGFVDRYIPNRLPVGLLLSRGQERTLRIAGIVANAREANLDRDAAPAVYSCNSAPNPFPWFLVRVNGEPIAMSGTVRETMKAFDPVRAVYDIQSLEQRIGDAFEQGRVWMALLIAFSATALFLACLGVYGTMSYIVTLRRREVGLRMALGARRRAVTSRFLFQALRVVGVASLAGLLLSLLFTRTLSSTLFGVSSTDPITLSGVVIIVLVVGTLAAVIPAVRASLADPMATLREE